MQFFLILARYFCLPNFLILRKVHLSQIISLLLLKFFFLFFLLLPLLIYLYFLKIQTFNHLHHHCCPRCLFCYHMLIFHISVVLQYRCIQNINSCLNNYSYIYKFQQSFCFQQFFHILYRISLSSSCIRIFPMYRMSHICE